MKKKKRSSILWMELKQDFHTFRGLSGKGKAEFVWDYYKWKILALVCAVFVLCLFGHILWEGQKPCRLRVCVVLNTEDDCSKWFRSFTEELTSDGNPGAVDINLDQPFDYDNMYYYVQEAEVMTTISSGRMDLAICGSDLYQYLLALNACLPLDTGLSKDLADALKGQGRLVFGTANLTEDKYGQVNPDDGIDGYYAIDLAGTDFFQEYNQTKEEEPLYAIVIRNTKHLADCETLIQKLTAQ